MIANRRHPAAVFTAVVFLFLLFIPPCLAQAVEEKKEPALARVAGRPKVGLVLSGGGARGVAHVGVLKVLEQLRVPVDFIAGTSMGSLVGGIYASGMSPDEMEKRIKAIDWEDIFRDNPARQDIPWRQKRDDYEGLYGLELGFRDGKLLLPLGTTSGYKFEFLMTDFVGLEEGRAARSFDTLPIPYRAVAMDLESGDMKVFDRGVLVKAMRASMSIPAAFAPVEIGGRLYVDGGMVRNLPVDVARSAGLRDHHRRQPGHAPPSPRPDHLACLRGPPGDQPDDGAEREGLPRRADGEGHPHQPHPGAGRFQLQRFRQGNGYRPHRDRRPPGPWRIGSGP